MSGHHTFPLGILQAVYVWETLYSLFGLHIRSTIPGPNNSQCKQDPSQLKHVWLISPQSRFKERDFFSLVPLSGRLSHQQTWQSVSLFLFAPTSACLAAHWPNTCESSEEDRKRSSANKTPRTDTAAALSWIPPACGLASYETWIMWCTQTERWLGKQKEEVL